MAQCALDCRLDICEIERLGDIVVSAAPHRFDGALNIEIAADQDNDRQRVQAIDFTEQLKAGHAGHHDVRQHQVIGFLFQVVERFKRAGRGLAVVAATEQRIKHGQHIRLVIDDEDASRLV